MSRFGQVWVGEYEGQGAYLILWVDHLVDGETAGALERYKALDLETGRMTHLITHGIDTDTNWTRYA